MYQEVRKGAAAPLPSRVSASLRSIPPLSLRKGQALDCIHPAGSKAIIGLSEKALLLIFLFLRTSHPEARAQQDVSPLCLFPLLAHVRFELAERILSSLSADKRSPEGLGLERIRGASYALTAPAKEKRVRCFSGTGNKLQVEVAADYSFDGFGYLTIQPSLKL